MKQFIQKHKTLLAVAAICLLIGGISMSFQNSPFGPLEKMDSLTEIEDTIPEQSTNKEPVMSMKDFDKLTQQMDKEMINLQNEISKIDFDKMHQEITASLNKVDFDKIKINLDKAMKDIDFSKLEHNVDAALKEIDWNKINSEVKKSLQDAKKEIEKINMEAVKKELEKAKLEIEKSSNEIKKINVDEIMRNANAGMDNAKNELRLTREMFNEMEKDRLINQKQGFTIEYKDKTLFINGKKQSEAVTNKYKQYIKGDSFRITISKDK